MFFSQLDLKLKVALGCFIGHSHWKSTRTTKCEQGVQEKWYSISLLGWSHYHIFLDFCFSCKSGILGLYCDTIILFLLSKGPALWPGLSSEASHGVGNHGLLQ